uniref:DnaJ homolog subfamily B member 9 n=1 Tax=Kryptolebias marmoratus TaxID=37003 RepID=A0A3Q3GKQ6_KRYMA
DFSSQSGGQLSCFLVIIVKNYYETLHVEATATDSQIKKSFRRLAVKYHPDKNKGTHAEKTFREIAEGKH